MYNYLRHVGGCQYRSLLNAQPMNSQPGRRAMTSGTNCFQSPSCKGAWGPSFQQHSSSLFQCSDILSYHEVLVPNAQVNAGSVLHGVIPRLSWNRCHSEPSSSSSLWSTFHPLSTAKRRYTYMRIWVVCIKG